MKFSLFKFLICLFLARYDILAYTTFYLMENKYLNVKRQIIETVFVKEKEDCFGYCSHNDKCASGNIVIGSTGSFLKCELLGLDRVSRASVLVHEPRSMYFDRNICRKCSQSSGPRCICKEPIARDCQKWYDMGYQEYGFFEVEPIIGGERFFVVCNSKNDETWTYIQARRFNTTSFKRSLGNYKHGFGPVHGDHWLGLKKIRKLLSLPGSFQLRIELETVNGTTGMAEYDKFDLGEEETFPIHISGYNAQKSSLPDALSDLNGNGFAVFNDADAGNNCGGLASGGWWYGATCMANLNSPYYRKTGPQEEDMQWPKPWEGSGDAIKTVLIMLRRVKI